MTAKSQPSQAIPSSQKVIIIGAGIGGLATANLLAAAGHDVTVYEANAAPGGRAGQLKLDGFTFDTGPSWYLMPEVFENYYALLGEKVSDHLHLKRLDPAYKVFFEDGSQPIVITADIDTDATTFEAIEPGAGAALRRYLARAERVYTMSITSFLYTNFTHIKTLMTAQILKAGPAMLRGALMPMDRYVSGFFRDKRLEQIMQYPMVFLGTSPYEAPSIYSLMSHMDFSQGVYYPQGGLYEIIKSMAWMGENLGVTYHYDLPVAKIVTSGGHASAVRLADGTEVSADIIISNADLHFTEIQLLDADAQSYPEAYWKTRQPGPSALLMYLGVRGELPQLEHHSLVFTQDWKQNFDDIFKHKTWPKPASLYICKASQTDPNVAPAGHENVFVLVPLPAALETAEDLEASADAYLDQIAETCGVPDLRERIVTRKLFGPDDFGHMYNAWQGTALGMSHVLRQSAIFRPGTRSKKVDNLYYVGANTMPGIGIPMCLISAELVYKQLAGIRTAGPIKSPIVQPAQRKPGGHGDA